MPTKTQTVKSIAQYLERRGYDILDESPNAGVGEFELVAEEPDSVLVFVAATAVEDFSDMWIPRRTAERAAGKWLEAHPGYENHAVRFDAAELKAITKSSGMVKYHIDAALDGAEWIDLLPVSAENKDFIENQPDPTAFLDALITEAMTR